VSWYDEYVVRRRNETRISKRQQRRRQMQNRKTNINGGAAKEMGIMKRNNRGISAASINQSISRHARSMSWRGVKRS